MSGCQGPGEGPLELTFNENRVSFWGDGNVVELDSTNGCAEELKVPKSFEVYDLKWQFFCGFVNYIKKI